MNATNQYLNTIMKEQGIDSNYKLAKRLGITQAAISRYRKELSNMDDLTALRVAKELNIHPLEVIASVNADRSKNAKDKKEWKDVVKSIGSYAASFFLVVITLPAVLSDAAQCILC